MKVKILNYCAAGLPIITTTIGASGYERVVSLIIENNLCHYTDIILELLQNSERLTDLGKQNRKFAEMYYDINKLANSLIEIYYETVNQKTLPVDRDTADEDIEIPHPLWLKENRVLRVANNKYYIIKNGIVTHSQVLT